MKRVFGALALVLLGLLGVIALHLALSKGDTMFAGKRPDSLGVKDGRLSRCKSTPNCVSSQADPADAGHYVAPIRFPGSSADAMSAVRKAVEQMERATVLRHEPNYLYAEFRSKLMGFVDDVEFTHEAKEGVIHVRSASRLGRRDFGVNRERVEALRARIDKQRGR